MASSCPVAETVWLFVKGKFCPLEKSIEDYNGYTAGCSGAIASDVHLQGPRPRTAAASLASRSHDLVSELKHSVLVCHTAHRSFLGTFTSGSLRGILIMTAEASRACLFAAPATNESVMVWVDWSDADVILAVNAGLASTVTRSRRLIRGVQSLPATLRSLSSGPVLVSLKSLGCEATPRLALRDPAAYRCGLPVRGRSL